MTAKVQRDSVGRHLSCWRQDLRRLTSQNIIRFAYFCKSDTGLVTRADYISTDWVWELRGGTLLPRTMDAPLQSSAVNAMENAKRRHFRASVWTQMYQSLCKLQWRNVFKFYKQCGGGWGRHGRGCIDVFIKVITS